MQKIIFLLLGLCCLLCTASQGASLELSTLWREADTAATARQPKTEAKILNDIYVKSAESHDIPQSTAAMLRKIQVEASTTENPALQKIILLKKQLPQFNNNLSKTVAKALLAKFYINYLTDNDYKIPAINNNQSSDAPMEEWNRQNFIAQINLLYQEILANKAQLFQAKTLSWKYLFPQQNLLAQNTTRDNLFIVFAFDAIDFYTNPNTADLFNVENYYIAANSPLFTHRTLFMKQVIDISPATSPFLFGLKIYQELFALPLRKNALVDADILRLQILYQATVGDKKNTLYKKLLKTIEQDNTPIAAKATAIRAQVELEEQNKILAHSLCTSVITNFANSPAAANCTYILNTITKEELDLTVPNLIEPQKSNYLTVNYKNLNKISLRIIKKDWNKSFTDNYATKLQDNLNIKAIKQWEQHLKNPKGFLAQTASIEIPPLDAGYYEIAASIDNNFTDKNNIVKIYSFWVTTLAVNFKVTNGLMLGSIRNAQTSAPISNAKIEVFNITNRNNIQSIIVAESDKNGFFSVNLPNNATIVVFASYKNLSVSTKANTTYYNNDVTNNKPQIAFFTDKAVYRPNQKINFKVIAYTLAKNFATTLANNEIIIDLKDNNGSVIDTKTLNTNALGSASTNFIAPLHAQLGQLTLQARSPFVGNTIINFEEYKKPQFTTELILPTNQITLGTNTIINGKTTSFSGLPMPNAKVNYIISRTQNMPFIWNISGGFIPETHKTVIKQATTTTAPDGSYSVSFIPEKPENYHKQPNNVFYFTINASVTSAQGETQHSSITLPVSEALLYTDITIPKVVLENTRSTIKVAVKNSTNMLQNIEVGNLSIYSLTSPKQISTNTSAAGYNEQAILDTWAIQTQISTYNLNGAGISSEKLSPQITLPAGAYRAIFKVTDSKGQEQQSQKSFVVIAPQTNKFTLALPHFVTTADTQVLVGNVAKIYWGTGYDMGQALVQIEKNGTLLSHFFTSPNATLSTITIPITEEHRGGISVHISYIKNYEYYEHNLLIDVPWNNKELKISTIHISNKLKPGEQSTWKLQISPLKKQTIELLATMYDKSIDTLSQLYWPDFLKIWPKQYATYQQIIPIFTNYPQTIGVRDNKYSGSAIRNSYPNINNFIKNTRPLYKTMDFNSLSLTGGTQSLLESDNATSANITPKAAKTTVITRHNFADTAFFFPQLKPNAEGIITIPFTMPHNLTTWVFKTFAHNNELSSGSLQSEVTVSQSLMVESYLPRFIKANDKITINSNISNTTTTPLTGFAKIIIKNAITNEDITKNIIQTNKVPITIPAMLNTNVPWTLAIPYNTIHPVVVSITAETPLFIDTEETTIPIVPAKTLLTDATTFFVTKPGTHTFTLQALQQASDNDLKNSKSLIASYTPNSIWEAIKSLNIITDNTNDNSIDIANNLYANTIIDTLIKKHPSIHKEFLSWKKNHPINLLPNLNQTYDKLIKLQLPSGAWPWFSQGPENPYTTLYVYTLLTKLKALNSNITIPPLTFTYLVEQLTKMKQHIESTHQPISAYEINFASTFLYAQSILLQNTAQMENPTIVYWINAVLRDWHKLPYLAAQAQAAVALHRLQKNAIAKEIIKSIFERATISDQEIYWAEYYQTKGYWYDSPIATQALIIEAALELTPNAPTIQLMKAWLLKQKRTQTWAASFDTINAVWALLLGDKYIPTQTSEMWFTNNTNGTNTSDTYAAGAKIIELKKTQQQLSHDDASIVIKKNSDNLGWGSIVWQRFADVSYTKNAISEDLKISRNITVPTPLHLGDIAQISIIVEANRDFEFLHLTDTRPSNCEPTENLSGYKMQNGVWYYQTNKDTSTDLFIDWLPKGRHIFNIAIRASHTGVVSAGYSAINSLFAPEFMSRSLSSTLTVE